VKTFIAILFVTLSNWSLAQTYVQINGASVHDRSGYNGFNYGAGLEQTVAKNVSVAAGWYRNSEYRGSVYAYGRYTVYQDHDWNAGIAVGAVTGYQRMSVLPMAFPELCYRWTCAMFVPKIQADGANAVGFRFRIPVN
jgi:hypothetical protein